MTILLSLILTSYLTCSAYRYNQPQKPNHSICDECSTPLTWFQKIPLYSYLVQRGNCSYCSKPIDIRFFLLECVGLIIGIFLTFFPHNSISLLKLILYFYIFCTDWFHQLIPDRAILLLLLINLKPIPIYLIFYALFLIIFVYLGYFGLGDVKLMVVTSMSMSFIEFNLLVLLASTLTLIVMFIKKTTRHSPFPFGCSWIVSLVLFSHLI